MRPIGLVCIAGAALGLACAAGGGQRAGGGTEEIRVSDGFPGPDELAAIARRPAPERVFADRQEDAAAWELRDAPRQAPVQEAHAPAGFWDGLLAAEAARREGTIRLTQPMACLARLAGQYTLERQIPPGESMLAFLAMRCAVAAPRLGTAWVVQRLQRESSDEAVQGLMRPVAEQELRTALANGTLDAGIWFGRQKGRAVALLVFAEPLAQLQALPLVPAKDGHVIIRGELLLAAERVQALINRGRYGYRACAVDPAVALPRFAVDCETDRGDEAEAVEIAAYPPRRIMGPIVARAQVWPSGVLPTSYRPPAAPPVPKVAGGDQAAGLVAALNEVRAAAGIAPVALAPTQSDTAGLLAPHYFAAEAENRSEQLDAIAIGVMAGWQVQGLVRQGHFTADWTEEAGGDGALLARVLARPSGRETLLDPDVRAVAVGTVRREGRVGAVFGSYAFLEAQGPGEAAAVFLRRIDEARVRRGLPASLPLAEASGHVAEVALSFGRDERTAKEAMQAAMEGVRRTVTSGRLHAWSASGQRLELLPLPEEIVAAPSIRVAVGVAPCKPRGTPWYGHCVLVAGVQQTVTASSEDALAPTTLLAGIPAGSGRER